LVPLLVIGSFFLSQLIVVGIAELLKALHVSLAGINETILNTIVSIIVYALTLVLVIFVPRKLKKIQTTQEELGVQRLPTWLDIALAPPGFIVYIVLSGLLTAVAMYLPWYDAGQTLGRGVIVPRLPARKAQKAYSNLGIGADYEPRICGVAW
jgi:preprotein translocase subunit SecY